MATIELADCESTVTKFFTNCESSAAIFRSLLTFLCQNKIEDYQVSVGKWKLKYSFIDAKYKGSDV